MYGTGPSQPAVAAARLFRDAGVDRVLELGAGQGRDTVFLAGQGFSVAALDYADGTRHGHARRTQQRRSKTGSGWPIRSRVKDGG